MCNDFQPAKRRTTTGIRAVFVFGNDNITEFKLVLIRQLCAVFGKAIKDTLSVLTVTEDRDFVKSLPACLCFTCKSGNKDIVTHKKSFAVRVIHGLKNYIYNGDCRLYQKGACL